MPSHARCWERAEVKPLKADINFGMSAVGGAAEDIRERRNFSI